MTAPSASRPNTRRDIDLTIVRRADVRRLTESGPVKGWLPAAHGTEGDRRYPSPRRLRQGFAFTIDLVLHLAIAIAVVAALAGRLGIGAALGAGAGTFLAVSILDRIVLQRLCQATVGKLLTGVCLIRTDNGGPPTTKSLVAAWFMGIIAIVANLLG